MSYDSDENIEETPCPLCGCEDREMAYGSFHPYAVVRCRACGFYYLSPRLTEREMLRKYREDAYFGGTEGGYTQYVEQEGALRATFLRLMVKLKRLNITGGSLLEVGCGYGYMLEEARDFFIFRAGTEFSHQAAEEARKRADRIYEGDIDKIEPGEKFDCIFAIQVIEHVYQPSALLEKMCSHLKPGGKILLATPDMGSFWRRMMGRRWPSFKIPEHILYFDRESLASVMRRAGLEKLRIIPYPHAFPLSTIAAKLRMALPLAIGKYSLWLPATTIAICGVAPDE